MLPGRYSGIFRKVEPLVQAILATMPTIRITFGYEHASPTKTAFDAYVEAARRVPGLRPPRDHPVPLHEHSGALLHRLSRRHGYAAHLTPRATSPALVFEAYLGGRWYTFDPRNNVPRIGRILMARGRDATDVAIVTSFGPCTLASFKVITDGGDRIENIWLRCISLLLADAVEIVAAESCRIQEYATGSNRSEWIFKSTLRIAAHARIYR